ncbi:suprabasin-like [Liolophura sinensis]|uniref:suprabasin-like n=1 Tax=Liolophura sinensis TaxID=3198878 RepID=UPI003158887F
MMIPYVGQAASVVLEPTVTVLNTIDSGVSKVEPVVGKFAGLLDRWTEPLKTVKEKVEWAEKIIGNFTKVVFLVEAKAGAAEGCVDALPAGRSPAIHALEGVSRKMDVFPEGFGKVLGTVNKGCSKVENVLSKLHVLRRRRGLPKLSAVKHVLDAILNAFGPLGHFLDKVDHILHKKFCLIHSLGKLVEEVGEKVIDGAEKVLKGAEHLGKEVLKGAKHFVDEAGHVWAEIEEGAEHVLHEVGHGLEHAGKEIAKGAEHVGKEVVKGAEHVAHEVGKGAEHVAHEVVKGAEHVGHEVAKGAEHVAHEVGKGISHVGHEVSHAIHHVGHVIHHIFGRRNAVDKYYLIDGKLYVLVDGNVDTRSRRGLDICIRVSDILKGVNYVTGGLMSKAQSLIDAVFPREESIPYSRRSLLISPNHNPVESSDSSY